MHESVVIEKYEEIAIVYLNEPQTLNALSIKLKENLLKTLNEIELDLTIKVVILAGKGRAFCAGGDIKGMSIINSEGYDPVKIKRNMDISSAIIERLRKMPKIVICAIHGYAAGAGFSLALASDVIIAEENTRLIMSFKNVGLIPDLGIHYHLPRIVGEWKAKEWIWNGMDITVESSVKHGFSIKIVEKKQLIESSMKVAKEFCAGPFQAFIYSKIIINNSVNMKLEDILSRENEIHTILRATKDHKEGVNAFFEKRAPNF